MSATGKVGNKASGSTDKEALPLRFVRFLREARAELRKVTWPNRQELIAYTVVVIITVIVVGVFIGAIDFLFSQGLAVIAGSRG